MDPLNECCPISLTPIEKIKHPVLFKKDKQLVVYSAEEIIEWLQNHSLKIPVTNQPVAPAFAHQILRPYKSGDRKTRVLLRLAGYLDGVGGGSFVPGRRVYEHYIMMIHIVLILFFKKMFIANFVACLILVSVNAVEQYNALPRVIPWNIMAIGL